MLYDMTMSRVSWVLGIWSKSLRRQGRVHKVDKVGWGGTAFASHEELYRRRNFGHKTAWDEFRIIARSDKPLCIVSTFTFRSRPFTRTVLRVLWCMYHRGFG
ncbi:hypothetical protein MPTK1_7g06370 [Marchantia polymorpha subsp. ruderalis]|uniref:Uncharacterized protein n=2 Tax=Marchantia polymorpha TaxID=3197 RepID=A0AAF6BWR2_MARPO|nr:hypothetical protein MARPO_0057s0034 [Marchantia polymorpha]BBN16446.1 hypothetical protein Mp_7g06370 [Marchantia polymorpha subsp. ruderalis]|eukprot:PTQ37395.1 hypothetical protein MARPO_0057s0034 [Marchantia polymorpha]